MTYVLNHNHFGKKNLQILIIDWNFAHFWFLRGFLVLFEGMQFSEVPLYKLSTPQDGGRASWKKYLVANHRIAMLQPGTLPYVEILSFRVRLYSTLC